MNGERKYSKTHHQEAWWFFCYLCEIQRFSISFFNWLACTSITKVEKNPGEERQYIKCDHCDKNSSFKNNLKKHSMMIQNKLYTNIPFDCYLYHKHLDTKNCPTNHDKCTWPSYLKLWIISNKTVIHNHAS